MTGPEDVSIRVACPADGIAITAIYNYYVRETPFTFDLDDVTAESRTTWFEQFAGRGRHQLLVAADAHGLLGYACSTPFKPKPAYLPTVETTIYLVPNATGRGIGKRLYAALLGRLATEDVHRAFAGIVVPNTASVALHESLGFERVGTLDEAGRKFDRWWTVAWYLKPMDGADARPAGTRK
jgi:phosphinothricin acetyltransferase